MVRQNYSYGSLAPYMDVTGLLFPVDWNTVFGRTASLEVEIGFGTGEYLVGLAQNSPNTNFLGLEQSADRIIKTLRKIHEAGIMNVRLAMMDASWAFEYALAPASVDRVHCLFPCPWPKKRHAKHRLFTPGFLRQVNKRLAAKGELKFVTDHHPYADWIMEGIDGTGFQVARRRIPPGFGTKFEKKWQDAGQEEFDELIFTKINDVEVPSSEEIVPMKVYILDRIEPARVDLPESSGPAAIQFKDYMFDVERKKGIVQAIVTEDRRTQYLWIMISPTRKGWSLSAAPGHGVLPTPGIRQALELAYQAFLASGSAGPGLAKS